jgi:cytochrome bd-type quinol oxidase subunit 2
MSVILTNLYLPVTIMLFGLIFRGVAFDFRAKIPFQQKWRRNNKFFYGSLLTSLAQGYILLRLSQGHDSHQRLSLVLKTRSPASCSPA